MTITLVQLQCRVGDLSGNCARIVAVAKGCTDTFFVTPELSICGYPPEDLLAYASFVNSCEAAAQDLAVQLHEVLPAHTHAVIGLPRYIDGKLFNVAQVYRAGQLVAEHRKNHLPNYGVFDEMRYFNAGTEPTVWEVDGQRFALAVCHDIWVDDFQQKMLDIAPDVLLICNASPFFLDVQAVREQHTCVLASGNTTVAYVNMVGGQDEHVFDGGSHIARNGTVVHRSPRFIECVSSLNDGTGEETQLSEIELIEEALLVGVRDYVAGSGAGQVFIGVSGGIDSAVVLCIAVAALGRDKVTAVLMPSRYTAKMSVTDGQALAINLGVREELINIESAVAALHGSLTDALGPSPAAVALENLQSRLRGNMLMTLANGAGGLVLTTGNKCEMATGYATLYGDMAGAFDVLKDLTKNRVYALARHFNRDKEIIPVRIIERPPTAELRDDQLDSDSLPDYKVLDAIIEAIVERLEEPQQLSSQYGNEVMQQFVRLLVNSEFKRRQAPIGPTLTRRAFGKDWRMPVINKHLLKTDDS